jgi:hypothetical protein
MMLTPDSELAGRLVYGVATLASTITTAVGGWLIAQTPTAPVELVGGGLLAVVGTLSLTMVLRAARHERQAASTIEDRLTRIIAALEEDLDAARARAERLLLAYDRERLLRIGFEEAARISQRRHLPPELELPPDDAAGL